MLILNPLFSSHMVFPANKPIRIFGTGSGCASITFAGITKHISSESGFWQTVFPPMNYGGPYTMTIVSDDQSCVLTDIFVGEVYLIAGQSNMEFKLSESNTPSDQWHTNDRLRLFSTRRIEGGDKYTPDDGWVCCKKKDAGDWSAIGYLMGNLLSEKKDIAVGLITCYQGASVIESWVPKGTFENAGIKLADEEKFRDHFEDAYSTWNGDGILFEQGISQILPCSLNAVIWYQGESDCSVPEAKVYAQELCLLIDAWRAAFADPELSFIVVQIADNHEPQRSGWQLIQQAQLEVPLLRPYVKTVISADICEDYEIHPRTKDKLAARIVDTLMDR